MKKAIVILIVICVFLSLPVCVSAEATGVLGFPVESFTEEEKNEYIAAIKLKLLDSDGYKSGISSFDVSESGKVVLAIPDQRIYVYDSTGDFLYGYYFSLDGDYGVGFVDENVAIYAVRGDAIAIYDPNGNCVDVYSVLNPNKHSKQLTQVFSRTSKEVNGKTYTLERDVEAATYARVVIWNEDGTKDIIYDISAQHSIGTILLWAGIIGFFVLVIVMLVKQQKAFEEWEGVWYSRELNMQISFTDPKNSFLMQNGEKIRCYCDRFQDKRYHGIIEVYCQEFDHPVYRHGKTLFKANIISLNENTMIVKECQEYTFVRTDIVD